MSALLRKLIEITALVLILRLFLIIIELQIKLSRLTYGDNVELS